MWHRIARVIGCTVAEAKRRVSAKEYREWCAYHHIEPFGNEWEMIARLAFVVSAPHAKRNRRMDKFIDSFVGRQKRKQSVDDMISLVKMAQKAAEDGG